MMPTSDTVDEEVMMPTTTNASDRRKTVVLSLVGVCALSLLFGTIFSQIPSTSTAGQTVSSNSQSPPLLETDVLFDVGNSKHAGEHFHAAQMNQNQASASPTDAPDVPAPVDPVTTDAPAPADPVMTSTMPTFGKGGKGGKGKKGKGKYYYDDNYDDYYYGKGKKGKGKYNYDDYYDDYYYGKGKYGKGKGTAPPTGTPVNWIDAAAATGNYDTLLDLVDTTPGVEDAIVANVPVTVFAPTDEAFAEIENVTATLNETEIANILAAHVVAGEYRASDVINAGCVELQSLNPNEKLKVMYMWETGTIMVNDALVVQPNLGDRNSIGVLHGIDKVLLGGFTPCPAPSGKGGKGGKGKKGKGKYYDYYDDYYYYGKGKKGKGKYGKGKGTAPPTTAPVNFIDAAAATGAYEDLLLLIDTTPGVEDAITDNVPVTVFAPNDAAFAEIENVTATLNETEIANILAAHVVAGEYRASDVINAGCVELQTLNPNEKLKVMHMWETGTIMVNDYALVVQPNLGDRNSIGVLHGIDKVLLGGFTPCPAPSGKGGKGGKGKYAYDYYDDYYYYYGKGKKGKGKYV